MDALKEKKLFLLDMDGTIYLDNTLYDGTLDFLNYVKDIGGKYIFLTNNSSKSVTSYIEKLKSLGITAAESDFLTSANATALFLKEKKYKCIYVLGTKSFKEQLQNDNLPITDQLCDTIDCLCMGFDTELTFKKLEDACILLNRDIAYIATNPDWVCPTAFGYVPDCGSVSQMLFHATKRQPIFIGKPEPTMVNLAMEYTGYSKEETVVIGDRIYTDIACGVNAGVSTIFVLSGEGVREDIQKYHVNPQFIFDDIRHVYHELIK